MASRKTGKAVDDVDGFLRALRHPLKPALEAVRRIILGAEPAIGEGIKWNSPSFRLEEYFATADVRTGGFVRVVFHTGAKVKAGGAKPVRIRDPGGLLEWHAPDRCSARFRDLQEVEKRAAELESIVKQWIRRK